MRKPICSFLLPLTVLFIARMFFIETHTAHACGGFERDGYLETGREDLVLDLPDWNFESMLAQVAGVQQFFWWNAKQKPAPTALERDVSDLTQALRESATPDERSRQIEISYRICRASMAPPPSIAAAGRPAPPPASPIATTTTLPVLAGDDLRAALPTEFALYLQGAEEFRKSGTLQTPDPSNPVLAAWSRLLDLPPAERRYRSVWAAFMMGKALVPRSLDDPLTTATATAISFAFEKTRALAAEGFPDSLGLVTESLGWQARIELMLGRKAAAIHLYYDMFRQATLDQSKVSVYEASLGPRSAAVSSIHHILHDVFLKEGAVPANSLLAELASEPTARDVTTIWMAARGAANPAWVTAVRRLGGDLSPDIAAQVAAVAYRSGDFASARELANAAGTSSTLGQWVRAKVLLYDGKVDEARDLLKEINPRVQKDLVKGGFGYFATEARMGTPANEYAVLLLNRQNYAGALEYFLRGYDWADAAYVAEHVMSSRNLSDFLKRNERADFLAAPYEPGLVPSRPEDRCGGRLQWVLGRKLIRAGKVQEGQLLLPANWRVQAQHYGHHLEVARDEDLPRRERALNYFAAAWIARCGGMEIMGTEVEPDWFQYGGSTSFEGASVVRGLGRALSPEDKYYPLLPSYLRGYSPLLTQALRPSDDERGRIANSAPSPNVRYHYRFVAAELGWKASRLLPDNDPALAYVLWCSGEWIADRDDKKADKFYQALVSRCSKLPIGPEADRIRWFPRDEKAPEMPEEIAKMVDLKLEKDASRW